MSFQITRDGGIWSAYETGSSCQGRFETRADVEQEIRRLQQRELEAAESDLRMAKKKMERTKLALMTPIRVDMQPNNEQSSCQTGDNSCVLSREDPSVPENSTS